MGSSVETSPKVRRKDRLSPDSLAKRPSKRNRRRSRSRSGSRSKGRHSRHKRDRRDHSGEKHRRYWDTHEESDGYESGEIKEDRHKKTNRGKDGQKDQIRENQEPEDKSVIKPRERKTVDMLTSKTGGAYIPPAKLRMMQAEITDKSSAAFQRIAWEALKKSIHGYINKINTSNIGIIARELLHENIIRGRGLLCKSIIQAQAVSPTFTNVYAALVAVINSKFPNIGELLLKRLVLQFRRGFKQNNKAICISASIFVAHLVNQSVAHEILALEILTLLIETPTDDSIEVAIAFLKECGQKLSEVSSRGMNAIFEMLRNILHEGQLEKRIQYMIEVMFQIRKDGFKDHAAILEELDIVEEDDQFTHLIKLDDVKQADAQDILNVFKFDEEYEQNEGKYKTLSKEILQSDSDGSGESGDESSGEDSDDEEEGEKEVKDQGLIIDNTETNLIILRRTIYLTIQSSLDFEECAHKLLKMELKPGQEIELCHMFLDCCAEQRTYEKFYGLLAQRFCQINKTYIEPFQQIFKDTYLTTHRLDTNRLRNVSKFFAHLLFTDAIGWEVFEIMKMNEEDTNSSSRIFIKILFLELAEYMGLAKLNARLKEPYLQGAFSGLFPRDQPKNTRFSINFFTSIGLGGLTDELREHLKSVPKNLPVLNQPQGSSSSSSSGSSDSSDSSGSEGSSSSEEHTEKKKHKLSKNKRQEMSATREKSKNKEKPQKKRDSREDKEQYSDQRRRKSVSKDREDKSRSNRRSRERDSSRSRKDKRQEEESSRSRKDYEWVKGRYEDNIEQLRSYKKAFQRDDVNDVIKKEVKKEKRGRSRDRVDKRDRRERSKDRNEGRRRRDRS